MRLHVIRKRGHELGERFMMQVDSRYRWIGPIYIVWITSNVMISDEPCMVCTYMQIYTHKSFPKSNSSRKSKKKKSSQYGDDDPI